MKVKDDRNQRERVRRRILTLVRKGYEAGQFDGVEVAVVVFHHGRFTTYRSIDKDSWPPSLSEIVCPSRAAYVRSDVISLQA